MEIQQSLGGGAHGFSPLKGKNVGVETPTYKCITSEVEVGWAFSPTKSKLAFTLAEVLITLGIIGVVAVMTMPTVIKNYQKKQTATQMRKTYAVLENALTMARAEHGELMYWEGPTDYIKNGYEGIEPFMKKYILPYIKYTSTCKGCEDYKITGLNGRDMIESDASLLGKAPYQVFLADGTTLNFYVTQKVRTDDPSIMWRVSVYFDINGKKKPNVIGKDVALLRIHQESNFYFLFGSEYDHDEQMDPSATEACHKQGTGRRCLNLLRLDNWEMKDYYPW